MNLKQTFFAFCLGILSFSVSGQTKYNGVVFTKLGQEIKGEITLNLTGSNNELIEILTTEISKSKGKRMSLTTTTRLNVAIIKHIVIKKQTYYLRDIKIDYDDKYLKNVCVKLIFGTINCGLFQAGDGTEKNSIAVKFPNEELSKLASVDFEYYNNSTSVAMWVSSCKTLVDKMINNDESVSWSEVQTREQRIERIKNIIKEYNECKLEETN